MKAKLAFIAAHAAEHAIRLMCRVLSVSPSWFHAWRAAAPKRAARQAARDVLADKIRDIFEDSRRRYGAPRIHAELLAQDLRISRKTVAKIMKGNGIRRPRRRRRVPRTTDSRLCEAAGCCRTAVAWRRCATLTSYQNPGRTSCRPGPTCCRPCHQPSEWLLVKRRLSSCGANERRTRQAGSRRRPSPADRVAAIGGRRRLFPRGRLGVARDAFRPTTSRASLPRRSDGPVHIRPAAPVATEGPRVEAEPVPRS